MRRAKVFNHGLFAGWLIENDDNSYSFMYTDDYYGEPISLTMPANTKQYDYNKFPPFFDGLLPEGVMLEALLKRAKLDRHDYFSQLVKVGKDLVGSVTVEAEDGF